MMTNARTSKFIVFTLLFMCTLILAIPLINGKIYAKEVTVSIIAETGGGGKAIEPAITLFNKKFAGKYKAKLTMLDKESLPDRYIIQFLSGSAEYDVLSIDAGWAMRMAPSLESVEALSAKYGGTKLSSFGSLIDCYSYNGKHIGLPVRFGTNILYYRKDLLEKAGLAVPKTIEEYLEAARVLTKKNSKGEIITYGTAINGTRPIGIAYHFSNYLFSHGGSYLTDDGKHADPSLKSNLFVKLLDSWKAPWDEGLTPNPLSWTYHDTVAAMQTGKLAMALEYSPRVMVFEDPSVSQVAGKMGYALLPHKALGKHPMMFLNGSWCLSVDKNSSQKKAAWELIKFLTSKEIQKFMALEAANGPTLLEIYEDPDYRRIYPAAGVLRDAIKNYQFRTAFPVKSGAEITEVVHQELQNYLLGRKSAKQTGLDMYDRIEKILIEE